MHVPDIHDTDHTRQAAASTAKYTTPTVLPQARIGNDNDLDNELVNYLSNNFIDDLDKDLINDLVNDLDNDHDNELHNDLNNNLDNDLNTDLDNDLDMDLNIDLDNDLDSDLGGEGDEVRPIDNDIGDLSSHMTNENCLDMATQDRLLMELLLEYQVQWIANHRLNWQRMMAKEEHMAAKQERWAAKCTNWAKQSTTGPGTNFCKMVDVVWYRGSGNELDLIINELYSNFNSHRHLFPPSGPDHINYVISLLHTCSNDQNATLQQTAMPYHSKWACDISVDSNPCTKYFELISQEIATVDQDNDRRRMAVIRLMQEYKRLQQESVRAYGNCLKANWRQAGSYPQKHEEDLYDIALAGLPNSLKIKVGQMSPACGRVDSFDIIFDKAMASEVTHVENTKPQQQQHRQQEQQQQQQQQQKQSADSSSKGVKRGRKLSISQPADTTGG